MKESKYKIPDRVYCEFINPIAFIFRKICSGTTSIIMGVMLFRMCTNSLGGINPSQSRHAKSAFRLFCTVFPTSLASPLEAFQNMHSLLLEETGGVSLTINLP